MSQHLDALAHGDAIRLGRAKAKAEIRAKTLSVSAALELDCIQSMTLRALLMAQSRWGETRAETFLARLALWGTPIALGRRVCELTERQKRVVVGELELE